jgi:hypothetical protein
MQHQELRDCDPDRWAALGEFLIHRRIEIDPRYRKRTVFVRETHMNERAIYDIEKARRQDFSLPTIIAIEQVYRLETGFVRKFLSSTDPAEDEPTGAAA